MKIIYVFKVLWFKDRQPELNYNKPLIMKTLTFFF